MGIKIPEVNFENILMTAMNAPGVKIDRTKFLKKELRRYFPEKTVEEAIRFNPAKAGIPKKIINILSKNVINYEASKVTSLSVLASVPGGLWSIGATSADLVSYMVFILRIVQEMAYLYGFEEFDLSETEQTFDSETMQIILLFVGTMFSDQAAIAALKKFSIIASEQVGKKLAAKALTKTFYYPIIKKVLETVGIKITKQAFADMVASAVPVIGGGASGFLTYIMFKPNCMKLRKQLMSYNICDPDFYIENNAVDNRAE